MVRHTKERATEVAKNVLEAAKKLTMKQRVMVASLCIATTCAGVLITRPAFAFNSGDSGTTISVTETVITTTESTTTTAETSTKTSMVAKTTTNAIATTTTETITTFAITEAADLSYDKIAREVPVNRVRVEVAKKDSMQEYVTTSPEVTTEVSFLNSTENTSTAVVTSSVETKQSTETELVTEVKETSSTIWLYGIVEGDADFILLCNAVGHEAGSNEVSVENKAKVVEVICNRKDSDSYPDTIYGVLTQKNQFSGSSSYVNLGTYSSKVTESVKEAVRGYLAGEYENHGYISFRGNGHQNTFS